MFRHGDRTPSTFYPKDPYKNETEWPEKIGKLTTVGKQQTNELGKWLRKRYENVLLNDQLDANQIHVQSSVVERTVESAISCLAGLYNVTTEDIHANIPVETVLDKNSYMVGGYAENCAAYDKELEEAMNSFEILWLLIITSPLRQYLTLNSGMDTVNKTYNALYNSMLLRDIFYVEKDIFGKTYNSHIQIHICI